MKHLFTLIIAGCMMHAGMAQPIRTLTVNDLLDALNDHPDLQESYATIDAMDRDIELAKALPDPSITLGNVSGDISGLRMPHQFYVGFDYTIETGGKRKHRLAYAQAGKEVKVAEHAVFVDEFKRKALLVYHQCWLYEQRLKATHGIDSFLRNSNGLDSIAIQILRTENDLIINELDERYRYELRQLREFVKHRVHEAIVLPTGPVWDPEQTLRDISESSMLSLVRAEARMKQEETLLEESNRVGDVTFTIGNNFITEATNPEAPSPHYNAITATVSFPLRFSGHRQMSKVRKSDLVSEAAQEEADFLEQDAGRTSETMTACANLARQISQIQTLIDLEIKIIKVTKSEVLLILALQKVQQLQQRKWDHLQRLAGYQSLLKMGHTTNNSKNLAGFQSLN